MDVVDKETDDDHRRVLGIPVKSGKGLLLADEQKQQQQQKKQVRRRLHTSRPYQERLLNMAEARREIVAALKFHRAAMKQSSNRRQRQETANANANLQQRLKNPPTLEEENQGYYSHHHTQTSSGNSNSGINSCCSYFLQQQQPNSGCNYLWPSSSSSSPSPPFSFSTITEDNLLDFPLPNQTLGLNLNFHQFANLETSVCHKIVVETDSPKSPAAVQDHGVNAYSVVNDTKINNTNTNTNANTVDELASTIGSEEHNSIKSAWWYKLYKSTTEEHEPKPEPDCNYLFEESTVNNGGGGGGGGGGVDDVPHWLSSEEESCLHEIDHITSQDHLLPRMEIGEIETIDADWLS